MEDCIFCKIVAGEIETEKVYEDEEILAFKDIKPAAPVHVLVIPKKHVLSKLAEASEEHISLLGRMQYVASKVAKQLGIGEGFRLSTNSGEQAGQVIWHIHYHLLGGWEGGRE